MKRYEALEMLKSHKADLMWKFGVIRLALFGSTARDAADPGSDIDILVTEKTLRPELRPHIEQDAVHV